MREKAKIKAYYFYALFTVLAAVLFTSFYLAGNKYAAFGCLFWVCAVAAFFMCRPSSLLNFRAAEREKAYEKALIVLTLAAVIALCVLPMSLSPYWNGEIPQHRNQYEKMAQAILEGHVWLDYDDDTSGLEALENPYDTESRSLAGVSCRWDHAWYNSRYYMYFGIVPVLLVFLPYLIITGQDLTTYHATQIFTAAAIIGIFALFYMLRKNFFPKMGVGVYSGLSSAASLMSFWFSAAAPALYCTAITSAVCMEVWSLYFYFRAVYVLQKENRQLLCASAGALFGALAFGCRPPVALVNIVVLPLLIVFIKQRKFNLRLFGKLCLAALPYFVIGAGLMYYNYIRFDDPFEFGQTYQLTIADQTQYGSFFEAFDIKRIITGLNSGFLKIKGFSSDFPYLLYNGAVYNFPIILLQLYVLHSAVRPQLKKNKLFAVALTLFLLPLLIKSLDSMYSPNVLERYNSDIYFIMGISVFLVTGFRQNGIKSEKRTGLFGSFLMWASLITAFTAFLLFCIPYDYNGAWAKYETIQKIGKTIFFFLN